MSDATYTSDALSDVTPVSPSKCRKINGYCTDDFDFVALKGLSEVDYEQRDAQSGHVQAGSPWNSAQNGHTGPNSPEREYSAQDSSALNGRNGIETHDCDARNRHSSNDKKAENENSTTTEKNCSIEHESIHSGDIGTVDNDKSSQKAGVKKPQVASYSFLNLQMQKMSREGIQVYNMSIGQSPFPVLEVAARALRDQCHLGQYAPVMGMPELRSAICTFHAEHDDVSFTPDDVIVGPGSKLLIDLLISVFDGDIVVTSPSWPSYSAQSSRNGKPFTVLPTHQEDRWTLRPRILEQFLSSRKEIRPVLLLICSPNNPAGTTLTEEDCRQLSHVCRKHGVTVMSDEIYARLHPDHISIAKFYPERTILSSGLSKWAAVGGWRIGYHMFPRALHDLRDAVMNIGTHTYSCSPTPVQGAALQALNDKPAIREYLFHIRRILKSCIDYTYSELTSIGVEVVRPSGGYFVLADFECIRGPLKRQGIDTGSEMCQKVLQETNIGFVAGSSFYRPAEELSARMVIVCYDGAEALKASRETEEELSQEFVQKHCGQLYTAVQVLKQWVLKQKDLPV